MKKLMLFLMIAIPLLVVLIVNLTVNAVVGDATITADGIELNLNYAVGTVGGSQDLTYSIYPENASVKDVVWASDNDQVAKVDSRGHVDFVGFGSVYVSATTTDGGNKSARCYFYVTDSKVHRVELSALQSYVYVGESLKISATVLPNEAINKNVVFSSSNEDVASVDTNGLVTGHREGNVIICATSEDGGLQGFIDVSVLHPVKTLTVEKDEIITASATEQVRCVVGPENATNKSVVYELDNDVAEINHLGMLTFNAQGEVNVKITTVDGGLSKTIKYIYTAGYAHNLIVNNTTITMTLGDADLYLNCQTVPSNIYATEIEFLSDDEQIAYVVNGGYLRAVKGGGTLIRVRVHSSATEIIEKQILVMVESPAESIEIDDGVTALNNYQLAPTSLPEGSTNSAYFYHLDEKSAQLASVSETGLITFLTDQSCTISVTIYANEDYGNVSKTINITYTAGKASDFCLIDKNITLTYPETIRLNYKFIPENVTIKLIDFSISEIQPASSNAKVVEILQDGTIKAVGGGEATIKLQTTLYDGRIVEEYCHVIVVREADRIDIDLDVDYFNNQFVTARQEMAFSGVVYPADATNKDIVWSISNKNIAAISNGKLIFKQVGVVTLTATCGQTSNSIEIYYTGSMPIYAEIEALMGNETCPVPEKVMVGTSFGVVSNKIIPSDIYSTSISLQITNQRTALTSGKVLEICDGEIVAVAGGSATLIIYLSGSLRFSYNILVERLPESLNVHLANGRVTDPVVELQYDVYPIDATNKTVVFNVLNPGVATIEGNKLTFKQNGVAHLTAHCEGNPDVEVTFDIEKVDNAAIIVSLDAQKVVVNKGDVVTFDMAGDYSLEIVESKPTIKDTETARVEGKYVRMLASGSIKVKILTENRDYQVEFEIRQLVEEINLVSDLDFLDGEYVIASGSIELEFEIMPNYAFNTACSISILEQISAGGSAENIAYIVGNRINFTAAGSVLVEVSSVDGNAKLTFRIRSTGGDAIDAQLNVGDEIVLEVGESKTIEVESWLPKDCLNTTFVISEISLTPNTIIGINNKSKTITALKSGQTQLLVELSNGITKEIVVHVTKKVTEIVAEDNILTSQERYVVNATALPADATNKELNFALESTTIATIQDNVIFFSQAGTVKVVISTLDGSNLHKTISITSTKGYLSKIELKESQIQLYKGDTAKLSVSMLPTDAPANLLQFRILSKVAADGSNCEVVSLTSDGSIIALHGGTATVRVFSYNNLGQEIYADCQIVVVALLNSFNVEFDHAMDYYQSAYITSKNEIGFTTSFEPQDASVRTFRFEISDGGIAKIDGNKIVFLQLGRVTIKIISDDSVLGEKSKTFTFYYTPNDLIEARLNKENISNGTIRLKPSETFKFSVERAVPSDNPNLQFSIININELRIDPNKPVASFDGDTISAHNGGTYKFTICLNNLMLDDITVIVDRPADGIELSEDQTIYISEPNYRINARAIPSDTQQTKLGYRSSDYQLAQVSTEGNVSFAKYGICEITVYVVDNPSVYVIVTIQYTKQLQSIKFNETPDIMFADDYIDLYVIPQPFDADEFEYTMEIDNIAIAEIVKQGNGYRLKGLNKGNGKVKVTAQVIGKDIRVEKTFTLYQRISDIHLELDAGDDEKSGYGGYRVFGNKFVGTDGQLVNTYQMKFNILPAITGDLKDILSWQSDNDQIATVDVNGLVTFLQPGKVTITLSQIAPFEGAKVAKDSYQFTLVDGVNVENLAQYKVAADSEPTAIVLQSDIVFENLPEFARVEFSYNVYGNGHILDHSKIATAGTHFLISQKSDIVLDNVTLRGYAFKASEGLSNLKGKGNTLVIVSSSALLYNTVVENGEVNIIVNRSVVNLAGCIVQNSAMTGIKIEHVADAISTLTVEDSVFSTSLIAGIMAWPIRNSSGQNDQIILKGNVRFYNWSTIDEIETAFVDVFKAKLKEWGLNLSNDVINAAIQQVRTIIDSNPKCAYTQNGKKYYHFGVVFADVSLLNFKSYGTLNYTELNPSCNYTDLTIVGGVNILVGTVKITFREFSLLGNDYNPFIKPGQTYANDNSLKDIKKPCRF